MTSVRNRRPQLSGSKRSLLLAALILLAACSPKIRRTETTLKPHEKKPARPVVKRQPVKPVKPEKPPLPEVSNISLLLPFGLDHLAPGETYTPLSLREADIALAYYRGFKLALDSLTTLGYNYRLQVFDTQGQQGSAAALVNNAAVRSSMLIVGPVFPEDLKAFISVHSVVMPPVVSPLSPASPATYKSDALITLTPPLACHARAAAAFISSHVNPTKIFILRSGFSQENEYIAPFKRYIDSVSNHRISVVSIVVQHGQLAPIMAQLSQTGKNVFVIPATDQQFLSVTLRSLDALAASYPVMVFGHPSWAHFSFLKPDMLQKLDTHITSADHIDYQSPAVVAFMKTFRAAYRAEASAYAIKGFDEGMYLGKVLATGSLKQMDQESYSGLHNDFTLMQKPGQGWVNTHVFVYKYADFELQKVE